MIFNDISKLITIIQLLRYNCLFLRKNFELIQIKPNAQIYIFCPSNYATGGPEALHQLGKRLIELGHSVFMYYFYHQGEHPVHQSYIKYNVPFVNEIENQKGNFLILPETFLEPIFDKNYSAIKKIVWWLSVTNYEIVLDNAKEAVKHKKFYSLKSRLFPNKYKTLPTITKLKLKGVLNLAHSHFSLDFLTRNEMDIIGKISDYMSDSFYERIDSSTLKEDILLYNPKKNGEYLDSIMSKSQHLNWKPLVNMSPDEVAIWMNKSKLYVDFGYHPGQERMPREAILMKCCVVTGSKGSAAYQDDVPVPTGFKFDDSKDSAEKVIRRLEQTLANFDEDTKLFKDYRIRIIAEKANFNKAVKLVFGGSEKN